MKTKLLFTALMLICGITAQAQSDMLTATLTHNGVHTTYTGRDCLTDALAASADGDVIALSGGNFSHNDYTITKPITLRGAGSSNDAEYTPTELKTLSINIPEDNTGMMVVEGIRFVYNNGNTYHNTWKAPYMRIQNCKSKDTYSCYLHLYAKQAHLYNNNFSNTYLFPQSSQADFQVQQCHGYFYLYDNNSYSYTIDFANCQGYLHQTTNNVTATINHCAFRLDQDYYPNPASSSGSLSYHGFYGCSFINSALVFLHYPQEVSGFRQNNNFNCCIVHEPKDKSLHFYQNNSNITTLSSSLYEDGFWDNYRPLSSWRDACTTTDGTEIGYMGGAYNATIGLSYPHFTNCTVPPVTDEEGHLNVTLTVSGVE